MEVKSRVPGKIVRYEKQIGDAVKANEVVVVMEAMKMKQLIPSPVDGVLKEIKAALGEKVPKGKVLAIVE